MLVLLAIVTLLVICATPLRFAQDQTGQAKRGSGAAPGEGANAADQSKDGDKAKDDAAEAQSRALDALHERQSVTEHTLRLGDKTLHYTATAGLLPLREELAAAKAYAFYTAYTLKTAGRRKPRPLTFCFNGGPGSSSVWLHLGAFGPKRVKLPDPPETPRPPFQLVDNIGTLLDVTDLVFIDPVTTGYSRAVRGEEDKQFHGVSEDQQWISEFIRLYTTRNNRWDSPKFLAGESYGTMRAAAVANHLQSTHGLYLNGIILVSVFVNALTVAYLPDNDLAYVCILPTFAATAHYHGQLPEKRGRTLKRLLSEVETFAQTEYAAALLQGANLPKKQQAAVARQLAEYTGLDADYIERCNLRVSVEQFTLELQRKQGRVVGRLDSRYTGPVVEPFTDYGSRDPSYGAIQGAYTAAMNHYVRDVLDFQSDLPYEVLSRRVHPWNWKIRDLSPHATSVSTMLRDALTRNAHLRVFVANGYYDMATPHLGTLHTLGHLGLEPARQANITTELYEAGHMMYVHEPSLKKLRKDLVAFITAATRA